MFKRKKKKDVLFEEEVLVAVSNKEEKEENNLEIEIDESTSEELEDYNLEDEIEVAISKDTIREETTEEIKEDIIEEIKEVKLIDENFEVDASETLDLTMGNFTFYNSDPNSECAVEKDEEQITEDVKEKKELSSYFEESKKDNKKIKEKKIKEKKKSKRQIKKEENVANIKDQKVFVFRNKKYTKVEDFITYLNNHYLEIDNISQEVLDNELFYGWLSKKSGVFDDSIKQFKEIKEKIEKK